VLRRRLVDATSPWGIDAWRNVLADELMGLLATLPQLAPTRMEIVAAPTRGSGGEVSGNGGHLDVPIPQKAKLDDADVAMQFGGARGLSSRRTRGLLRGAAAHH
jgi:hypothetical protein